MPKEIGVKMFIKGTAVIIKSPVRSKVDKDGNLILTFKIGKDEDEVKLIFDKKEYLDIEE